MCLKATSNILFWTNPGSSRFLSELVAWNRSLLGRFLYLQHRNINWKRLKPWYFHKLFLSKCSYQNSLRDGKIMLLEVVPHVHSLKQRSLLKT